MCGVSGCREGGARSLALVYGQARGRGEVADMGVLRCAINRGLGGYCLGRMSDGRRGGRARMLSGIRVVRS